MKNSHRFRTIMFLLLGVLVLLLGLTFVALIRANKQMEEALMSTNMNDKKYNKHYALIMENPDSESGKAVLEGCLGAGERNDAYVELLGADLREEYSRLELMNLAIEANVDGIIVEAEESDEFREMLQKAADNQIPTVTIERDCMDSARISYVGIGAYDLGREYARQIIKDASVNDHTILVLMDMETDDSTQNIICNGIRETIANEGNHLRMVIDTKAVDSQSYFSADESIRKLVADTEHLPDFIVCLNEQNTEILYNAIVNYNVVGEMKVLGYDTSEVILEAIEKDIITSTVAINYEGMGETGVSALDEYDKLGNVNGFFLMDVHTINKSNIKEYMGHGTNS